MMVKNLRLAEKLTRRTTTKILLKRLTKLGKGTKEIEKTAKLIRKKGGDSRRNKDNVIMVLRNRLEDAEKEEKVAKKEHEVSKEELKKLLRTKESRTKEMLKRYQAIKSEEIGKLFKELKDDLLAEHGRPEIKEGLSQ